MSVMLLAEHHLECLSIKEDCTGLSESLLVKCNIIGNHMSRLIYKKPCVIKNYFSYFLTNLYVVGTQTVLLSTQDIC